MQSFLHLLVPCYDATLRLPWCFSVCYNWTPNSDMIRRYYGECPK